MTVQVTAGVTGAINFSGAAVGGGGPYWGAELAAATSTNSEIMAGFDWIGLRERVADGFKERLPLWRETRTCGILRTVEALGEIFCPGLRLSLGVPGEHNFQRR